jgi:hypothetical protein
MMIVVAGCSATATVQPTDATSPLYNPVVTQKTLGVTICVKGWTAMVRPPVSYTSKIKATEIAALLPGSDTDPTHYELDHVVPLEVGGSPANPANLKLQLWPEAHAKDAIENDVHAKVCAHQITLAAGRRCFVVDWRKCP